MSDGRATWKVITDLDGFYSLEKQWREIEQFGALRTPFQSYSWSCQWLRHRGSRVEPFMLVSPDSQIIAPFVRKTLWGVGIIELLGAWDSDYQNLVTVQPMETAWHSVAAQLCALRSKWNLLHLHSVQELSIIRDALSRYPSLSLCSRVYEVCPIVDTNRTWEKLLAERKNVRKVIKRWRRRVEEMGPITVEVVKPPITAGLIDEIAGIEKLSWKWEKGIANFSEGSLRSFLVALLQDKEMPLELWILRVSGQLAAIELVLLAGGRWYGYLTIHRSDYKNVGSCLLAMVIEKACETNCPTMDLLRGDEEYKLAWTDDTVQVYEVVCSSNAMGWLASLAYKARWKAAQYPYLKQIRNRLLGVGDRRPRDKQTATPRIFLL